MQTNSMSSLFVKAVYLLTYLNQFLLLGYLILYFSDKADLPLGMNESEQFELILGCISLPLLCHFGLYCRDEFDLIQMRDGTSPASRFIWTMLALSMNLGLLHIFLRDIVRVY